MCNFKIDKIAYSNSQSVTTYDDSKNKPSLFTLSNKKEGCSCLQLFCKKDLFFFFCKTYRKIPFPESLFGKVAGLKADNFINERLWHRFFPVNFAKFLRTPIL